MATDVQIADVGRNSDQEQRVLVDNGVLHIKQLRAPDRPQQRELREYIDKTTRSIQPATGDQVVYRLKETNSSSSNGGDVQSAVGSPQVAVLGSTQVPVGLSSALGYLQLGQLAVVKVPEHLMGQTVDNTDAKLQSLPDTPLQPHTPTTHHTTAASLAQPPTPAATPVAAAAAAATRDQAPASAAKYPDDDDQSSNARDQNKNACDRREGGGVTPPLLPQPVPQQQTLRERFSGDRSSPQQQQQQQHGRVAALAAKFQHQQGSESALAADQSAAATPAAAAGSGVAVQRLDSDHSSWLPDSAAESRMSMEVPAATAAPVTNRMPSASGWTSGTSSPRSDGGSPRQHDPAAAAAAAGGDDSSTDVFYSPGGTSYHSAVSTPISLSHGGSSALDDKVNDKPLFLNNNVFQNSKPVTEIQGDRGLVASPQQCLSPDIGASPEVTSNKGLPGAAVTLNRGLGGADLTRGSGSGATAGYSGVGKRGLGKDKVLKPSTPSSAIQTPDQVLQAAAKKLEIEQQQRQQRPRSFDSVTRPSNAAAAANSSTVAYMVPQKRNSADGTYTRGPGARQTVLPSGAGSSNDGSSDPFSARAASSNAPSFKSWVGGRNSSNKSTAMTSVAEDTRSPAAAAAAAAVQSDQQQQQGARVSLEKRMRYSGDYGSMRQSQDLDRGPMAAAAGSSSDRKGGGGGGAAAAGSSNDQDHHQKEYELEVLAIIPGRGKLSGQPVLSEAAQQEDSLDIDRLTKQVSDREPHFKPPKPQKGFSGWVKRHWSVNWRSPANVGKRGATWLGIRDCFKGSRDKPKDQKQ